MFYIFLIYFFLLGIVIGSFLNVVILRLNTGRTTGGRSACMTCSNPLSAKELVPVLSYIFQRGKCRHCKTYISIQYPLVEFATALLFAGNFILIQSFTTSLYQFIPLYILSSSMLALLVAIFVYDLKHHIIPDQFSFTLAGLSVAYLITTFLCFGINPYWIQSIPSTQNLNSFFTSPLFFLNAGAGIVLYLAIYLLWKLSKGRLIGLGDAKLLFGIGTVLGFVYGLSAFFLSFWIGALFAFGVMLRQHLNRSQNHITMKSEIAFGPFLIIAFLIVYFFKIDVTNIGFILENFL